MSYSDFTLDTLRRKFSFSVEDQELFRPVGSREPSAWLKETLQRGHSLAFTSEKARSEFIVAPVLVACRDLVQSRIHVFSGVRLDADPAQGLTGECDFLLARTASSFVLQAPVMVVLEAKKNDIEEGLGQCGAQMLGARIYNERDGKLVPFIYGCVTTGEMWQFLRLEDSRLLLHPERFNVNEMGRILWVLVQCIEEVERHAPAEAAA